jgi:hypothetical protein
VIVREVALRGLLLPAVLFWGIVAHADAPPTYCHPLDYLQKSVKDCADNHTFVEAANLCLQKIDRDVQAYQTALAANMQAANAAAADAQSSRITNNGTNLTNMNATLTALLASAQLARTQLVGYEQNFVWPGPLPYSAVHAMGAEGFLGQFSCYGETKKYMDAALTKLDGKILSLQKTATEAAKLDKLSGKSAGSLKSSTYSKTVQQGRAPAQELPKYKPGQNAPAQGNVTGVEADLAAEKQKNNLLNR